MLCRGGWWRGDGLFQSHQLRGEELAVRMRALAVELAVVIVVNERLVPFPVSIIVEHEQTNIALG